MSRVFYNFLAIFLKLVSALERSTQFEYLRMIQCNKRQGASSCRRVALCRSRCCSLVLRRALVGGIFALPKRLLSCLLRMFDYRLSSRTCVFRACALFLYCISGTNFTVFYSKNKNGKWNSSTATVSGNFCASRIMFPPTMCAPQCRGTSLVVVRGNPSAT